jgi:GT2 family glycosyltransferase
MGWAARTSNGASRRHREPLLNRPGAVCVVSGDRTTYPQFAYNVATLRTTRGTNLLWQIAGGGGVARARNILVEQALQFGAGWVWFIDDDHVFSPDILGRLLRHDVDIVVPAVLLRQPPHDLVAWQVFPVSPTATDDDLVALSKAHKARPALPAGLTGLVEVGHAGAAGMLISSEVLEQLEAPWFEWGRFGADGAGEDTWFCLKARRAGFQIFCDLDTPMGHLNTCAVWPQSDVYGGLEPAFKFDFGNSDSTQQIDPFWAAEKLAKR